MLNNVKVIIHTASSWDPTEDHQLVSVGQRALDLHPSRNRGYINLCCRERDEWWLALVSECLRVFIQAWVWWQDSIAWNTKAWFTLRQKWHSPVGNLMAGITQMCQTNQLHKFPHQAWPLVTREMPTSTSWYLAWSKSTDIMANYDT